MPKAQTKTYQALSSELDDILAALQQPNVQVDEAVKLYERGLAIVKELESQLKLAENKIEKLTLASATGAKEEA